VPDWITVTKEVIAGIETVFHYQAAENHSYKHRSAAIAIGDAKFELTQWGSPYVAVPFLRRLHQSSDTRLGNARRRIENREISRRTVEVKEGGRYSASMSLKAEIESPVGVEFGQRTDPHSNCGLFEILSVPTDWKQITVHFRAAGHACGADNNRLAIHAGKVLGKLWISDFSLTKE
jgi:hypothetical protein